MSTVLITGVTGFRNRGVEALVKTNIEGIKKVFPNSRIKVLTDTPDYDQIRGVYYGAEYSIDVFRTRKAKLIKKLEPFTKYIPLSGVFSDYKAGLKQLADSEVVLATGGDIFSSDYGDSNQHLYVLELAQRMGKKTGFVAHSIGPFKRKEEANYWKKVAEKSDLITVRESFTQKYITEQLGLSKDKVVLTADTAFLLDKPAEADIEKLCRFYNIDLNEPTVVLSISQGIKQFARLNHNEHFNTWKEIIRVALEDLKLQVVLIPHVQERFTFNDDRIISNLLIESLQYDPRIKVISGDHSASEFKGIISKADLVIAERMHAAIAGLSTCVPTAVLGYSIKAKGIMFDLFGKEAEEKELIIPIKDLINKNDISRWLKDLWMSRENIKKQLELKIPGMKKRAEENFSLISAIIG